MTTTHELTAKIEGPYEEKDQPGTVWIPPATMSQLGVRHGDYVCIKGARESFARVCRTSAGDAREGLIHLDNTVRRNTGTRVGVTTVVTPVKLTEAQQIVLVSTDTPVTPTPELMAAVGSFLRDMALVPGDNVRVVLSSKRTKEFRVEEITPPGPAVCSAKTEVIVRAGSATSRSQFTYANIGGLGDQLRLIREVVELPLTRPELFQQLSIEPPRGILMTGPPGCGKTLIARTIANETSAHFIHVSGPEIMHRYYGESEEHLREIFKEARDHAPSIIFFDEIDAIAPRRGDVDGEVEKRVAAQLMVLMDGLDSRGQVVVIAATNAPDNLDSALRRPGRFDRELSISPPDYEGRLEIIDVHLRPVPLADDVDRTEIASRTSGFVGADLAALVREGAMNALRHHLESGQELVIRQADFEDAIAQMQPSVMRGVVQPAAGMRWDELAGLDQVKQRLLEQIVWPIRHREIYAKVGVAGVRGILLHGPSGIGKTTLVKALAQFARMNFIPVEHSSLMARFLGDGERALRDLFDRARRAVPALVFIDDIDRLFPAQGTTASSTILRQFIQEIDRLGSDQAVILVGATTRLDAIEYSLLHPGRFELSIELKLPNESERLRALSIHTMGKPLSPKVDLETVAAITEGLTYADISHVCRRAALLTAQTAAETREGRTIGTESVQITLRHFRMALDQFRAEIRERMDAMRVHSQSPAAEPLPEQATIK